MSTVRHKLEYTPKKRKRLSGPLSPTYKEDRKAHEKSWQPYYVFGVQPNNNGVQVYHHPQGVKAIRMLALVLNEVADRMEETKRFRKFNPLDYEKNLAIFESHANVPTGCVCEVCCYVRWARMH